MHGSGGGGGGCRAPSRAGAGGSGHGLPLLVGGPASMRGGGLERGSAGGSWRRVPAYTPGGDFSVMPLSTSSIRSSSITTAGTGGGRVGEGTRQLLPLYPGRHPSQAPGVPPGAGQWGKVGSGGYSRDEEWGITPLPGLGRGSMPPGASRLPLDG